MSTIGQAYFPKGMFNCYFEEKTTSPLVVSPVSDSNVDLIDWSQHHQQQIADAIKEFGAIAFSGFNLTKENFPTAFTAITGIPPQVYKGNSPREEVGPQIYKSTAVADGHTIPLHQEVSGGDRKNMPKYLSFFCANPPKEGTGQTLVGNVKRISEKIQAQLPELWKKMLTTNLTYTARYLPENSWRTRWIRWLNPSHATIKKRFGTENRAEVEAQCRKEGFTCEWDGQWAVVSQKGIPATIDYNGSSLLCNQIYVDKLNPTLCGHWILYIIARILLYPTSRSMQYDVKFDDGTEISHQDAATLLTILKEHQQARNWKKNDLLVLDNVTTMHGKAPHSKTSQVGQREILVAMGGSIVK